MTEDIRTLKDTAWLRNLAPFAWPRITLVALAVVVLLVSMSIAVGGPPPGQAWILLAAGLVGGTAATGFLPSGRGLAVLAVLVVAEYVLLGQAPEPWSSLSALLIPANGAGAILGQVVGEARAAKRRPAIVDAWVINGNEQKKTDQATASAIEDLAGWDSATTGRFVVGRNGGLFEAVGSAATGFIVHCTADYHDDGAWRVLGSLTSRDETELRMPFGPVRAPMGVVSDLQTTNRALLRFFHYRGPDPDLHWTSGEQVLDLKFG